MVWKPRKRTIVKVVPDKLYFHFKTNSLSNTQRKISANNAAASQPAGKIKSTFIERTTENLFIAAFDVYVYWNFWFHIFFQLLFFSFSDIKEIYVCVFMLSICMICTKKLSTILLLSKICPAIHTDIDHHHQVRRPTDVPAFIHYSDTTHYPLIFICFVIWLLAITS